MYCIEQRPLSIQVFWPDKQFNIFDSSEILEFGMFCICYKESAIDLNLNAKHVTYDHLGFCNKRNGIEMNDRVDLEKI